MSAAPDPAVNYDERTAASLRVFVKLLRATKSVTGRLEATLAIHGLTPTQLGVLEAVWHLGPMSQRDLGRKVLTSAGNMTDVIDKLAARGLVTRCQGTDRRSVTVILTGPGRTLIGAVFPTHAAEIAGAMEALSCDELDQLNGLLRRLGQARPSCDQNVRCQTIADRQMTGGPTHGGSDD